MGDGIVGAYGGVLRKCWIGKDRRPVNMQDEKRGRKQLKGMQGQCGPWMR